MKMNTTYLISSPESRWGYCCVVLKRHAVELSDLSVEEGAALMKDIQRVAKVLQTITEAVKLNDEIHGNTIPHLHVHLLPRYKGDPFEEGTIDPPRIHESPYKAGEFENFRQRLQGNLSAG
jgi:diadenosine tetraphosphate (Ap4A) HIT family hydrolase